MNPIKPTFKSEILPILLITLVLVSSFYFFAHFGEQVPTHWNFAGEADAWSSRAVGAFLFPGIIIGIYLLFLFLPKIDPRANRYQQFRRPYLIFRNLIILFMTVIYFLASLAALGYNISISTWVPALVGVLFIFIGNYMAKIKSNWFVGIKTPWTLSSEEVWNKTHRFGAKAFISAGLLIAATAFTPVSWRFPIFLFALFVIIFGTVFYSYFIYKKEIKK